MRFTVTEQIDYDLAGNTVVDGFRVDRDGQPVEFNLTETDAILLCESLNVHEQTGLTPAQLQARVAELEGVLTRALPQYEALLKDCGLKSEDTLAACRVALRNA